MNRPILALKVDVDTERGTRLGVPRLAAQLRAAGVPACFLFSLGPDHTGRAVRRIFRPGFLRKVSRTSVVRIYGVRTLLRGTLLPAPQIGRRHTELLRRVRELGFEVGIHCHDHYRWQDHLLTMRPAEVRAELGQAVAEFRRIFGEAPRVAGAPGWQANAVSRQAYDELALRCSSDARGSTPFFPRMGGEVFRTLEVPTTLPTLDELLGRPEFPEHRIVEGYLSWLRGDRPNVLTIHAEIEGMAKNAFFNELLERFRARGVRFVGLLELAEEYLDARRPAPVCELVMAPIDGRSGRVATQAGRIG